MDTLRQKLLNQRRVPWVGCVGLAAVDANVVRPAERRCVGERVRFPAMLKRRDVVDLEEARLTTLLATPTVTI